MRDDSSLEWNLRQVYATNLYKVTNIEKSDMIRQKQISEILRKSVRDIKERAFQLKNKNYQQVTQRWY